MLMSHKGAITPLGSSETSTCWTREVYCDIAIVRLVLLRGVLISVGVNDVVDFRVNNLVVCCISSGYWPPELNFDGICCDLLVFNC